MSICDVLEVGREMPVAAIPAHIGHETNLTRALLNGPILFRA